MTKKDELRQEARTLGINVKVQWSIPKLQTEIARVVAQRKRQKKAADVKRTARVDTPKARPVVVKKDVVLPVVKTERAAQTYVLVTPKYRAMQNVILPSRRVVDIGQVFECDEHTAKKLLAIGAIEPA